MELNDLSDTVDVLSAMITPAVMISAYGSLILTTHQRLGKITDRIRQDAGHFRNFKKNNKEWEGNDKAEYEYLKHQLLFDAKRAKLLQRTMTCLYLTLGIFLTIIVVIGVLEVMQLPIGWVVILLGISGAILFFIVSIILIRESRLGLKDVDREMDFITREYKQN